MTLQNVTLSGNVAADEYGGGGYGGGISHLGSHLNLTNVTFSNNAAVFGAALYSESSGAMVNSVLAGSTLGANCSVHFSFPIVSHGSNLSDDATCSLFFSQPTDSNDEPAGLLPLANYGGPTWTHMPAGDSLLLNNGSDAFCPAYDQRGVPRPYGIACDIGAVEFRPGVDPFGVFLPAVLK